MNGEGAAKEQQTISEKVEEQKELLYQLLLNIDSLVERNPRPEDPGQKVKERPDNVFDEIINTLTVCRGLIREATEKVETGISRKVQ